jgi:hypothetical protein
MAAGACFAAGLMRFEPVSYHVSSSGTVTEHWVPIFLALATAGAVVASLVLGKSYDKVGITAVVVAVVLASLFSPPVFFGGFWVALAGLMLWGYRPCDAGQVAQGAHCERTAGGATESRVRAVLSWQRRWVPGGKYHDGTALRSLAPCFGDLAMVVQLVVREHRKLPNDALIGERDEYVHRTR